MGDHDGRASVLLRRLLATEALLRRAGAAAAAAAYDRLDQAAIEADGHRDRAN